MSGSQRQPLYVALLFAAAKRLVPLTVAVFLPVVALAITLSTLQTQPTSAMISLASGLALEEVTLHTNNSLIHDHSQVTVKAEENIVDEVRWNSNCITQKMEISGIGMGNGNTVTNPQTISLNNFSNVPWLLAQVAGRRVNGAPVPQTVTFTTSAPQSLALNLPSHIGPESYDFVTTLTPAGHITATVSLTPTTGDNFPRGLILYAIYGTPNELWTSIGRVAHNFVYGGAGNSNAIYTETFTLPSLTEAVDLTITAVIIDNNEDDRSIILEAVAGNEEYTVTEAVFLTHSTEGDLLNIASLTLPQVPTGTNNVSVSLRSPGQNQGDSVVFVGVNVGYLCNRPSDVFLPIVKYDPTPTMIPTATPGCIYLLGSNNYITQTEGPLALETDYCGWLDDESDYYHFDLSTTGKISITLRNGLLVPEDNYPPANQLAIYGPNASSEKDYFAWCCEKRRHTVLLTTNIESPGRYYVQVKAIDIATLTYTLTISDGEKPKVPSALQNLSHVSNTESTPEDHVLQTTKFQNRATALLFLSAVASVLFLIYRCWHKLMHNWNATNG